ncbi:helix-turn-helix transcriptional regulator [Microbacterium sp. BWR-S6Y]|uniref:helix-turn-helix transcriptional regulator n=1 Tax=Microbacterium sp. BWR-S6Y TaxID=3232073 RepID=UPI003528658A
MAEPDVSRLARRLKELRADRGLTYEQLAEASGLSRRGVIALETGERGGTVATWYKVSHALGVTSAEFFGTLD